MDMYGGKLDCDYGDEIELQLVLFILWMPRGVLSSVYFFCLNLSRRLS